jgi:endonuclease/exonuclease/phosphatase family metal-dependent hydrolase
MEPSKRRPILGIISIFALFMLYRVFTVYTVRSGECRPKPIDPNQRWATRDESGRIVTFPAREGYPPQARPLVVMTYNIEGHDELYRGDHAKQVAAVINAVKPDIVGLQEVHRGTWQVRFRDQYEEIRRATGMKGWFGASYTNFGGRFGNALLTRGDILSGVVHPLPSVGEPRSVSELVVKIDGATLNIYVTHLCAWGGLKSAEREEELDCLAKHVRTSRYPFLLLGDLNAPPNASEIAAFDKRNAAQMCGREVSVTHPFTKRRIDYIFADYGWNELKTLAMKGGPSDHWPLVSSLYWSRNR